MTILNDEAILGKTIEEARELAKPLRVRVRREDGKGCMGTCDFVLTRINVEVTNGIVTKILPRG